VTQEENKKVQALMNFYIKEHQRLKGSKPVVNRNKLQYLLVNILKDLSVNEIKELMTFYIKTDKDPSLLYFCYEYDTVIEERKKVSVDLDARKALMRETQQRVKEYRERYGNAE